MYHPGRKREAMGDDPAYLTVGTEVSAKYKGAFCEAKVRKVVRSVKCRVTFKLGLGTALVTDDQVKGTLRAGANVEVKHPEKKEYVEATITKIQDCSQYTVVFDDGDITTLRRTALCLKSGRHFAESETLDQLPLTHPEHFSNPVIGGRRGRRSRQAQDESSDEEEAPKKGKKKDEKEADIGKVVCVELGDKKKQKDNWFPGLVVAPTAQDTVRIRVRDDYLVRSFKDGRYYTVPKKEATEFTREIGSKVDNNTLKTAVEKALLFLDKDELPPHWDRELLFGIGESSDSGSEGGSDSDSSDDERQEEKDHFVAQLYKFMDDCGTPINKGPTIFDEDLDLYKLFKVVHKLGGYNRVTNHNQWKIVTAKLSLKSLTTATSNHVKQSYKKYLHSFEDFYRKLGCTMVNHPRGSRARHRSGRSLIRDRDRATPINTPKVVPDKEKPSTSTSTTTTTAVKKQEPEEEKKKPAAKVKEEKPKPKEEKKEIKEKEPVEEAPKPRRELKMRSERLKLKEEEVAKKQVWRDGSQSEEEAGSSHSGLVNVDGEISSAPSADTPDVEPPEPKWGRHKDDDDESRESADKPGPSSDKKEETRERRRPLSERRAEEEEKALRTRSKGGGVTPERRTRESRTPIRDAEKKTTGMRGRPRSEEPPPPQPPQPPPQPPQPPHPPTQTTTNPPFPPQLPKKRGRKRKDSERSRTGDETGKIASDVQVQLNDKLKVYYGPTHESKVTYEAKVIEIEEDGSPNMFLVHYTGWNTRYDEWIPRTRIAENLSWTPARAKRSRLQQQQQQQQQNSQTPKMGRGRPAGRSQEGSSGGASQHTTRSTTPSSVTSSSSRTKSPASSRAQRAASRSEQASVSGGTGSNIELRRRPRRVSGPTDFMNVSESDSSEFEELDEPIAMGLRRRRQDSENSLRTEVPEVRRLDRAAKRRPVRKERSEEEEEEAEEREGDSDSQGPPRRSGRRTRRVTESERKEEEQPTTSKTSTDEQPKGRDIDLNQIRSELKGFDKAVKSPVEVVPTETDTSVVPTVKSEPDEEPSKEVTAEKIEEPPASTSSNKESKEGSDSNKDDTDDIYEFKEPEPFEFEVRTKRETTLADERIKLSKRPAVRLFDEVVEPKPTESPKTPTKKKTPKKDVKASPKVEEIVSPENETKKRRRGPVRRLEDEVTEKPVKSKSPSPTKSPSPSKQQQQQTQFDALTASDEAFKKLYDSTTFPVLDTQTTSTSPVAQSSVSRSPRPLDLFGDLPAGPDEDHGDDEEGEDRLVISETDAEPPLFSYPQRHEEMLPTPSSRLPCSASPEPGKSSEQSKAELMSLFNFGASKESEVVKLVVAKDENEEGTVAQVERPVQLNEDVMKLLLKEDDDDEEDSINAAIQRVISQSMTEEEDDMDIFGKSTKPTPAINTVTKSTPKVVQQTETFSKTTPKLVQPTETYSKLTPKPIQVSEIVNKPVPKVIQPIETYSKATVKLVQPSDTASKLIPLRPVLPADSLVKTIVKSVAVTVDAIPVKPDGKAAPPAETVSKPPGKTVQPVDSTSKIAAKVSQPADTTVKTTAKSSPSSETFGRSSVKLTQPAEPLKVAAKSSSPSEMLSKAAPSSSPTQDIISKPIVIAAKASTSLVKESTSIAKSSPVPEPVLSKLSNKPTQIVVQETSGKASPKTILPVETLASKTPTKSTPLPAEIISKTKTPQPVELTPSKAKIALPVEPVLSKTRSTQPPVELTPSKAKTIQHIEPAFSKTRSNQPTESPPSKTRSAQPTEATPSKTRSAQLTEPTPSKTRSAQVVEPVLSKTRSTQSPETILSKAKTALPVEAPPSKPAPSKAPQPGGDAFSKLLTKTTPQQSTSKEIVKKDVKKEPRKKALKKTVSKEFIDDSSSDSDSSEELKLVIDKLDEESVPDASDLDLDVKKEEPKKETPATGKSSPNKRSSQEMELVPKSLPEQAKKPEVEIKVSKACEPETKKRKEENIAETSKSSELKAVAETSKNAKLDLSSSKTDDEEADSSLNSLLCEETIPKSPVRPDEISQPVCEDTPKIREIPFASMPAGGNGASTSSATQQAPKPFASRPSDEASQPVAEASAPARAAAVAAPAPVKKEENEAAPVMENTPPTTPDSSLSTISGSPREDRAGSSPPRDESCKSHRDSSEVDLDSPAEGNKGDPYSEDSLLNVEVSSSCDMARSKTLPTKRAAEPDKELPESPAKKRRRPCKKEDVPSQKRIRHSPARSSRNIGAGGSDSDENSENSNPVNTSSISSTDNLLANRSPRPSKYNFYVELDPELDGGQRIAVLQHKLQELRKTYMAVKAELAGIDRRRKKLRRREREANKAAAATAKQEVWCA